MSISYPCSFRVCMGNRSESDMQIMQALKVSRHFRRPKEVITFISSEKSVLLHTEKRNSALSAV